MGVARGPIPPTKQLGARKSKSDRRMDKSKHRVEADSVGGIHVPAENFLVRPDPTSLQAGFDYWVRPEKVAGPTSTEGE